MSPNLSFERFAIVLALTGCSKATPAADTSTTTVRSDPTATVEPEKQVAAPTIAASAAPTTGTPGSPAPRGSAGAIELKHKGGGSGGGTGQASCGAGSCTSEIKKK